MSVKNIKLKIPSAFDRYMSNSRIVLLGANTGKPVNLTSDFYPACDPDVSFDGRQIIFAGKYEESYHLF